MWLASSARPSSACLTALGLFDESLTVIEDWRLDQDIGCAAGGLSLFPVGCEKEGVDLMPNHQRPEDLALVCADGAGVAATAVEVSR